jgi:hypothetical protein
MPFNIERPAVDGALYDFALAGHGLVLGRAGVGKSFSLSALARSFETAERTYLVVGIESIGDATEADVRSVLGYEEESFASAMGALFATSSQGTVIFDGFDAARNEDVRTRVLALIRGAILRAPDGWTVVVSAREYDARKSPLLLRIFPRSTPAASPFRIAGISARHFAIPELTDKEVATAIPQIPGLKSIYEGAGDTFRRLAHIPFNLWLLDRVLSAKADITRIRQLESEVQLLDLYWFTYVSDQTDGESRIAILRLVTSILISTRRLTFTKAQIYTPDLADSWKAIFSADVLAEGGGPNSTAHFSHNILFDYAVSVLAIPDSATELTNFLTSNPSRPLFLRPSLLYFFVRWWYADRGRFWKYLWQLLEVETIAVRVVARIVPPYVVASDAKSLHDLEPLLQRCRESKDDGPKAVLRVLQALRVAEGADAAVWTDFVAAIASTPSPVFAWELAAYLRRTLADARVAGRPQMRYSIAHAARQLFLWAWAHRKGDKPWYDAFASALILPIVLETASTDADVTVLIVQDVLSLLSESHFPIRYFNALAEGITELAETRPDVVATVYRALFAHEEKSAERTSMGGIVLKLTSNRRQDFGMCHYALARDFPAFLDRAPESAVGAGLDVLNIYSERERGESRKNLAGTAKRFLFRGTECDYVADGSASWSTIMSHEEEALIANALENFLTSTDLAPDRIADLAASHAKSAWTWGLLLKVGSVNPAQYANVLFELALSRPIQLGWDTQQLLASFVEAAAPHWSRSELDRFQRDALHLKEETGEDARPQRREQASDLLLTRVPMDLLGVDAARERVGFLHAHDSIPGNEPPFRFSSTSHLVTPEMWLEEEGVDLKAPANASLFELATKMRSFTETWSNKAPSADVVASILPELDATLTAIRDLPLPKEQSGDVKQTDPEPAPKAIEYVWTHLAGAAHACARSRLDPNGSAFATAQQILCRAAECVPPEVGPDRNREFTTPSWSPSPRTESIQGLSQLAFQSEMDPVSAVAFATFADSPEPSERFLVAMYLPNLWRYWSDLFWEVLAKRTQDESTPSIVATLIRAIWVASDRADERGFALLRAILPRWLFDDSSSLRQAVAVSLARMAFINDDPWGWKQLRDLQTDLDRGHEVLSEVISDGALMLVEATTGDPKPEIAGRVISWFLGLLSDFGEPVRLVRQRLASDKDDSAAGNTLRILHDLVGELVQRLYFGTLTDPPHRKGSGIPPTSPFRLDAYIELIRPVLRAVLSFADIDTAGALSPMAAHNFMQLLNVALPFGPEEALAMAARTAASGSATGYQFDSLAVKEVVALVEVILADYRDRLTEGEPLANTLALLDTFADAGWPEALRLVWRLDEVFR